MNNEHFLSTLSKAQLEHFCQQWQINELSLFGSVLRPDFRQDSDVDVLITFEGGNRWSLLDLVRMKEELETIFHRSVDLLTRRALEQSANQQKRERILASAKPVFLVLPNPAEASYVPG